MSFHNPSTYPLQLRIFLLLWICNFTIAFPSYSAERNVQEVFQPSTESLYQLGAGDRLKISVFEAPELSGEFEILPDGTLGQGAGGSLDVSGLTIDEASAALTKHYFKLLKHPIVTLTLIGHRAARVAISGEVTRPGVYTLGAQSAASASASSGSQPTLTQLIQQAGGITQIADIRSIFIESQGGRGKLPVTRIINLWQLLQATDLSQDPILTDGDRIRIPATLAVKPEELRNLSQASFSPATLTVNIVGEVVKPGVLQLPPNTPLNQAILAAGGFNDRSERSNVELFRLEPDGSVSRRQLAIDFKNSPNEQRNPLLRPNDVVVVSRNGLTTVGDNLKSFINTFTPAFGLLNLFGIN
jgi:polysaccharide biosynthesis/export protein